MKAGDNWTIVGRKGCGKTTFFKELIKQLAHLYPSMHIYVMDNKRRDFNDWPNIVDSDEAPQLLSKDDAIQVWQPLRRIPDEVETWLERIVHDVPAIVAVDEGVFLRYTNTWSSEMWEILQKIGRDLPLTTMVGTQDIVKMPRTIISQSDHIARFSLRHPYEQSLMKSVVGDTGEPRDRYGFFYSNQERGDSPLYFHDMQEFFGLHKS